MIKARHFKGELNYADCVIPATKKSEGEILFTSYICHPQMANNELSGPAVLASAIEFVKSLKHRRYDYRFVIAPETIGSIVYLSKHLKHLQESVKAGFVLTCIGDDMAYSYLATPSANTLADRLALNALKFHAKDFKVYDFTQRGSDERQYCSPLVNLPVCDIMRSKYGRYPQYHTSLDDLSVVTPSGLAGGAGLVRRLILTIEANQKPLVKVICEPNLGKRGLYPTVSSASNDKLCYLYRDFLAFCDGKRDLLEKSDILQVDTLDLAKVAEVLSKERLI